MTIGITKSEKNVLGEEKPRNHYDRQYPAVSFRIDPKTKEILQSIKSDLGKSWNQTFLQLARLYSKNQKAK